MQLSIHLKDISSRPKLKRFTYKSRRIIIGLGVFAMILLNISVSQASSKQMPPDTTKTSNTKLSKINHEIKSTLQLLDQYNITGLDEEKFYQNSEYRAAVRAAILIESHFPGRINDLGEIDGRGQIFLARQVGNNDNIGDVYEYIKEVGFDINNADLYNIADASDKKRGTFYAMYHDPEVEKIAFFLEEVAEIKFEDNPYFFETIKRTYFKPDFTRELLILKNGYGFNVTLKDFAVIPNRAFKELLNIQGLDNQSFLDNVQRLVQDQVIENPTALNLWKTKNQQYYLNLYKQTYIEKPQNKETLPEEKIAATPQNQTDQSQPQETQLSFEDKTLQAFNTALQAHHLTNKKLTKSQQRQAFRVLNTTRESLIDNFGQEHAYASKKEKRQLKQDIRKLAKQIKQSVLTQTF